MVIESLHQCHGCDAVMLTADVVLQRQFERDHEDCPAGPCVGCGAEVAECWVCKP